MEFPTKRPLVRRHAVLATPFLERARVAVPAVPAPPDATERRPSVLSVFMTIALVIDLAVLGLNVLIGAMVGIAAMFNPAAPAGGLAEVYEQPDLLWVNAFIVLVLMGLIPLAWVLASRRRPLAGAIEYLGLHRPFRSLWVGTGLAGLLFSGSVLLLLFFAITGLPVSPREVEDHPLPRGFGWPLIIMVSFAAGFGEEILFRGLLFRWVGWIPQALLFGLAHLASGEPLQLMVTTAVGLLFGRLRQEGWSLWTLIVAHIVYDFCLLTIDFLTSG